MHRQGHISMLPIIALLSQLNGTSNSCIEESRVEAVSAVTQGAWRTDPLRRLIFDTPTLRVYDAVLPDSFF
jgi:hypothetical protein